MTNQLTALRGARPTPGLYGALAPIQREFDRLFDRLSAWNGADDMALALRMDLAETPDAIELTVELPGMTQDQVKVALEDDVLMISGEKSAEKDVKEKHYRLSERSYGAFSRAIPLPHGVDADKITAVMKNGVLKISAPKDGRDTARPITIQAAQ